MPISRVRRRESRERPDGPARERRAGDGARRFRRPASARRTPRPDLFPPASPLRTGRPSAARRSMKRGGSTGSPPCVSAIDVGGHGRHRRAASPAIEATTPFDRTIIPVVYATSRPVARDRVEKRSVRYRHGELAHSLDGGGAASHRMVRARVPPVPPEHPARGIHPSALPCVFEVHRAGAVRRGNRRAARGVRATTPSSANASLPARTLRVIAVYRLGEGVRGQGESFPRFPSDSTASRDPALALMDSLHDVHAARRHSLDAAGPR